MVGVVHVVVTDIRTWREMQMRAQASKYVNPLARAQHTSRPSRRGLCHRISVSPSFPPPLFALLIVLDLVWPLVPLVLKVHTARGEGGAAADSGRRAEDSQPPPCRRKAG